MHTTEYKKAGHLHSHLVQEPTAIMLTSPTPQHLFKRPVYSCLWLNNAIEYILGVSV